MCTLKHKVGVHKRVANTLSKRLIFLTTMQIQVIGFNIFKDLYDEYVSLAPLFKELLKVAKMIIVFIMGFFSRGLVFVFLIVH